MLQFILNDETVTTQEPEGSTVLDFARYHKRLKGTKIGCREGDCGACTILVGSFEKDQLVYRSITSCLMPLGNATGKHIVTVEGVNMKGLSPVQQAMVDTNGTQCGFCTLGFVMSFTGFVLNGNTKSYNDAIAAIDGNICRCTGYKSIERSAEIIAHTMCSKPNQKTINWLVENSFVPAYFTSIEERLRELRLALKNETQQNETGINMMISGGTDLIVQRPLSVKKSSVQFLFDEEKLKEISVKENECTIGASVTVTDFVESEIIQNIFPEIEKYIKLISSTPIRNMATLAGNLVNASPIGDMSIFFLALDASLLLNRNGERRTVQLKEFYKAYKIINKAPNEIIEKIIFHQPVKSFFNFEKVSKRTHLDIASVNSACQLQTNNSVIKSIHLSAGGVAPFPKYLNNTCSFLTGKKLSEETLCEALFIMNEEIAPISDARGKAAYKRLLLRQLVLAHFINFFRITEPIKKMLLK